MLLVKVFLIVSGCLGSLGIDLTDLNKEEDFLVVSLKEFKILYTYKLFSRMILTNIQKTTPVAEFFTIIVNFCKNYCPPKIIA